MPKANHIAEEPVKAAEHDAKAARDRERLSETMATRAQEECAQKIKELTK